MARERETLVIFLGGQAHARMTPRLARLLLELSRQPITVRQGRHLAKNW
jgi:hypothetical protein